MQTSSEPLWHIEVGHDSVTILLTIAELPESSMGTTLRLNSESAARLAKELRLVARTTAGRLSTETFIPGDVLGMKCKDASDMLRALGLTVVIIDTATAEERPRSALTDTDRVAKVEPPIETVLFRGSSVRLYVATDAATDA